MFELYKPSTSAVGHSISNQNNRHKQNMVLCRIRCTFDKLVNGKNIGTTTVSIYIHKIRNIEVISPKMENMGYYVIIWHIHVFIVHVIPITLTICDDITKC